MSQHKRDDSISDYLDKDTSQQDLQIRKKTKMLSPGLQALDNPSPSSAKRAGNLSVMNKQSFRLNLASPPRGNFADEILSPKSVKSNHTRNILYRNMLSSKRGIP